MVRLHNTSVHEEGGIFALTTEHIVFLWTCHKIRRMHAKIVSGLNTLNVRPIPRDMIIATASVSQDESNPNKLIFSDGYKNREGQLKTNEN